MRHLPQLLACLALASVASAQLAVTGTQPALNAGNCAPATQVVIDFDRALASSVAAAGAIGVFGSQTGPAVGAWTLESNDTRARFTPQTPFAAGEVVHVGLANSLAAADATPLRSAGYSFAFRIASRPASLDFEHLATHVVRTTPSQRTRVYGGVASDLDDDGFLDLSIINQDSSDVRVLMNQADGTGNYNGVLFPVNPVGSTPSPSEPADMNQDGFVDLVTGNKVGDSVSVLIGNGNGTFQPRVTTPAGDLPRGIALLDMDGDGDTDVVTANANSSNLSKFFNNGAGVLSAAVTMEGGGAGEWGLAAGDMNEDGIADLVVGAQNSQRVIVWLGNGDGTFTQGGVTNNVDGVWMIVLGDVNGDGHLDASLGNGTSNTGVILLGDGAGNLTFHQRVNAPAWVVATDLGDVDGDGDLDWVLSSFTGAGWTMYLNDGTGTFTFERFFAATANGACALLIDIDNDLDLDLALLDEIADEVVLMENVCRTTSFCFASPNSTSMGALATMTGSCSVADNDLSLHAGPLPNGFGFWFYGSATQAAQPAGNGALCLGGSLFRSPPSQSVGNVLTVDLDLASTAIAGGTTWYFQAVFRDVPGGGAQFNFSDGVAVPFLP